MKSSKFIVFFATFALCLVSALGAGAAEAGSAAMTENNIHWAPDANASHRLVVSGPGGVFTQDFAVGETPFLDLRGIDGNGLADGHYTFELRSMPVVEASLRAEMRRARARGDEAALAHRLPQGSTQMGYFLISGGAFIVGGEEIVGGQEAATPDPAQLANKDQVFLDDLIVAGSICAGLDCVNGESFGFDTLRLKENNLRIKFQDTSATASFPSNDWQITANDSGNGGANKFSIDDIDGGRTPFTIEASAPSHSLYVDDGGRIGIGTSTPVVEMHVVSGDSPTLRLEQDGSSGFTAQTWDVAGNETNFFVRDATNGSRLPFKILPSAPTNSIYVAANGDVGLGTASPNAHLHSLGNVLVDRDGDVGAGTGRMLELRSATANTSHIHFDDGDDWFIGGGTGNIFFIAEDDGMGVEFRVDSGGNITITGSLTTGTPNVYPDYVFESDYDLMPLSDLAQFIEKNGHLPNIPTAEEVEAAQQINMSEMQIKLLEKVEELTLYTLQQQKTIEELQQRLEAQSSDVE